jgi:hypothetical protein
MTPQELQILLGTMRDAGDSFARNRQMTARKQDVDLDRAMRQDEAASDRNWRSQEAEKDRGLRERELQENRDWREEMKKAQSEANAEQREAAMFRVLGEMNEAGALTDEGLAVMQQQIEKKFGPTGIGVKLFRRPPPKVVSPSADRDRLDLAEDYRARMAVSKDPEEQTRFKAIAERLERGGTPESEGSAEITEEVGPIDPLTGKGKASVRRKVPRDALADEMRRISGPATGDVPEAPTDPKARKPGTVYQTPKGALKWTGTGWVKP